MGSAFVEAASRPARKITLRSEWTLAVFTFLAILLVSWFSASLMGGPGMHLGAFLAAGLSGMALSSLHLGRRGRAWRAVLNWRRSWLSREVITYPLFLGVVALSLAVASSSRSLGLVAVLVGLACLSSVDGVYAVMARERRSTLDQVNALLSAAFLAGVFAGIPALFLSLGIGRLAGFVARWRLDPSRFQRGAPQVVAALRLIVGFVIPLALWLTGRPELTMAAVGAVVGEFLDRGDFYDSLDVVSPRNKMASDLLAHLDLGAHLH